MERPQSETGRRRRMEKNKERVQFLPPGRMLPVPPMVRPPAAATNEVRLAAIAVELNIRLRSADMPGAMQEHAFRFSRALLDANNLESKNPNPTHIAMSLKKVWRFSMDSTLMIAHKICF
jgi:dynein light chain LC8-type